MTGSADFPNPFQLCDTGVAGTVPEVLGLWATAPGYAEPRRSFDPAAPFPVAVPVWRTRLPLEPAQARKLLEDAAGRLAGLPDSLQQAEVRVLALKVDLSSTPAFDLAGMAGAMPPPEKDLVLYLKQWLAVDQEESFALRPEGTTAGDETVGAFRKAVAGMEGLLMDSGWVETLVGAELVGRTAVSWLGKMETVWPSRRVPVHTELHRRTLELVLQSRQALLQVLTQALGLATKIGGLLAFPGGAILALPTVWKFMHQVMAEQ
jgi:hypothetical protein